MAFIGQDIVDRAWSILQDQGARWNPATCLRWVNDAQREVLIYLPSANPKTAIKTLTTGTRQTLTALGITDGIQFITMRRNFAADGTTPGPAVSVKPMQWIDESSPNWHSDTAAYAKHVFFDVADPKTFYCWPPADGSKKGEILYSALPAELTALSQAIGLDDIYANAMQYYVLSRSMSNVVNGAKMMPLAGAYYTLFMQSLGVKDARLKALDANLQMVGDGSGVAGPGGP